MHGTKGINFKFVIEDWYFMLLSVHHPLLGGYRPPGAIEYT